MCRMGLETGTFLELVGFEMLHVEMGNGLLNERLRRRGPLAKPHRWSSRAREERQHIMGQHNSSLAKHNLSGTAQLGRTQKRG